MLSAGRSPPGGARQPRGSRAGLRPGRLLPRWRRVLVVVAHPDDETFGLGGLVHELASGGAAVHVLCYTHGEASALTQPGADLYQMRAAELRQASAELGVSGVTLLDYADGELAAIPAAELARHVHDLTARHRPGGLLVFDENGITGHPDHQAATRAAVLAAAEAGLPVLAWALPAAIAARLREETGQAFAGQPPDRIDLCVRVNREAQRKAALLHASQLSPTAVLWRRLQLAGDCEHLRWLLPSPGPASGPDRRLADHR